MLSIFISKKKRPYFKETFLLEINDNSLWTLIVLKTYLQL